RFAPKTHGAVWIGLLRCMEGAPCFPVIESVSQGKTLVEVPLGERVRRGDFIGVGAEALPKWHIGLAQGSSDMPCRALLGGVMCIGSSKRFGCRVIMGIGKARCQN